MIEGFNLGTIFGTKFTRSRKFYPIDPDKPIADRYLYAQRYGHYGKNLIHQVSNKRNVRFEPFDHIYALQSDNETKILVLNYFETIFSLINFLRKNH